MIRNWFEAAVRLEYESSLTQAYIFDSPCTVEFSVLRTVTSLTQSTGTPRCRITAVDTVVIRVVTASGPLPRTSHLRPDSENLGRVYLAMFSELGVLNLDEWRVVAFPNRDRQSEIDQAWLHPELHCRPR